MLFETFIINALFQVYGRPLGFLQPDVLHVSYLAIRLNPNTANPPYSYVWLPLTISGTTASLTWYYNWVINAVAGTWSAPPADNSYEAESSTNTRTSGTQILSCTDCSGTSAVGYIGGSAGDTLTFNGISSSATTRTTIRMRYTNGDTTQRFADITVNGVTQRIAFVPTGSGQITGVASMTFNLNSGTGNTLKVAGVDGGYAPDVDRIVVPVS